MYFLIAPYKNDNQLVQKARFKAVCEVLARYNNLEIVCPIIYAHTIKETIGEDCLKKITLPLEVFCEALMVYKLPGWEIDKDVQEAIAFYSLTGRPITYTEPLPEHLSGPYYEVWANNNLLIRINNNGTASTNSVRPCGFTKL